MGAVTVIAAIAVGIATGMLSGCGVGGGTLLMLYLTALADMPQRAAAGVNLLYLIACAPPALVGHIRARLIVWKTALWTIAAGVPVSLLVARFAQQADVALLRRGFGVLLILIGAKELFCRKVDESVEKHYND